MTEHELPTTIREAVKQAVATRRVEAQQQQQPGLSQT